MVINQGDVFRVDLGTPKGSGPGYRHPHVVIQNNLFNRSKIATVVVCVLTSNLKRAGIPGNVLLEAGEANLPHRSVVNVTQVFTVDKASLVQRIGRLSGERVEEVRRGLWLLTEPRDPE